MLSGLFTRAVPSAVWVCWTRAEKITRVNAQILLSSLQTRKPPRALLALSSLRHHLNILCLPLKNSYRWNVWMPGSYCSLSIINSSAEVFVKLKVCWTRHAGGQWTTPARHLTSQILMKPSGNFAILLILIHGCTFLCISLLIWEM